MKAGDYVRTENGEIGTIIDCPEQLKKDYGKWLWFETTEEQRPIRREQIDKSSPNIIDLIEVGDYVNGCPVLHKEKNEVICGLLLRYKEKDIKSIVTHEQFSQMEYKVGG